MCHNCVESVLYLAVWFGLASVKLASDGNLVGVGVSDVQI
jgi:hypothetical protein